MTSRFFETFCELLESVPAKAVIPAAEAEGRMVEDDLANKRAEPDEETISVLSFCNCLAAAAHGLRVSFPSWPVEHCAFYWKIVQRLAEAGELPFEFKKQFEQAFSRILFSALRGEG